MLKKTKCLELFAQMGPQKVHRSSLQPEENSNWDEMCWRRRILNPDGCVEWEIRYS